MKSTVLQFLLVFFSYLNITCAVRYSDPFEEFLRRERLREEEYRRHEIERLQQEQEIISQKSFLLEDVDSGSGQESSGMLSTLLPSDLSTETVTTPLTNGVTTAPQRQQETRSTCCVLGARAGRSGFLCNPENYRPQTLLSHELNRLGNFKVNRMNHQRYVEVRQYSKCISGTVPWLSDEFQRCCKHAYIETLDEEVVGAGEGKERPIMLELPLQIDIISKQRKTHHKTHVKV